MGSKVNNLPVNFVRPAPPRAATAAGRGGVRGGKALLEFAPKVRELLKARKVSQTELAEAIGTSQQVVSRWLETNTPPKSVYLLRLSRYFDVPVDYLIDDDQVELPRAGSDLSEDERVVLAVVRGLRDLGVGPEEILKRLLQQAPPVIRWGKGEAEGASARAGRPEDVGLEPVKDSRP